MINLSSFIRFHALRSPERTAIVYGGERLSYRAFLRQIEAAAAWLAGRGIGAGDVVAVLMRNSTAFLVLAFAASHRGAVFLPVNFRLASDEVGYITGNAGAKLLLVDAELAERAAGPAPVAVVGAEAQHDLGRLVGSGMVAAEPRGTQDLFRLMYTSGTTDRPKGVMHSYENFYAKCAEHVVALGLTADTRLLVAGPLYHVGAFDLPGVAVLWLGGTLVVQRDFDPAGTFGLIERERIDGAWLAPVMTGALLALPDRERFDRSSLRWVVGGGERTPEQRIRAFGETFPEARYIDAYGLTESCSGDTFMEAGREIEKIGSTGRATPHVEIEVRDDAGRTLAAGETGEICLRGPKVTKGYWKDPAKTAASFFGDWFRTGDVGYLDSDGFLYLTDRKKDMILSGGENIASSEVERVLYELPQVRDAAVLGVPDARWGERPVAVVVLAEGAELDIATVAAHCRGRLAGFKVPKQLVLRQSLPRNPSGKILKRELRAELATLAPDESGPHAPR